ncbi:MAG TPA: hypothetical protein PLJ21_11380, partial [Pseudobdellovibrionaceae bacterium]|nr:hypothetical protein [Pseudobdellovibrionaceae bacterium]
MNLTSKIENLRILLIENNELDALKVKKYLQTDGQGLILPIVNHIHSLSDLKSSFKGCTFDVIIFGIKTSDERSSEDLKELLDWCNRFPILVLLDEEDVNLGIRLLHEGAQEYLFKSY